MDTKVKVHFKVIYVKKINDSTAVLVQKHPYRKNYLAHRNNYLRLEEI